MVRIRTHIEKSTFLKRKTTSISQIERATPTCDAVSAFETRSAQTNSSYCCKSSTVNSIGFVSRGLPV